MNAVPWSSSSVRTSYAPFERLDERTTRYSGGGGATVNARHGRKQRHHLVLAPRPLFQRRNSDFGVAFREPCWCC